MLLLRAAPAVHVFEVDKAANVIRLGYGVRIKAASAVAVTGIQAHARIAWAHLEKCPAADTGYNERDCASAVTVIRNDAPINLNGFRGIRFGERVDATVGIRLSVSGS